MIVRIALLVVVGHVLSGLALAGMQCDGIADDTAAFQALIGGARTGQEGASVHLPATTGTCLIAGTITVANVQHLRIEGHNANLRWAGDAGSPLLLLQDTRDVVVSNLRITAFPSKPLLAAIQIENGPGSAVTPTHNVFQYVTVECVNGGCINGIRLAQGAGGDNNNDFNTFQHVAVHNVSNACARIEHAQSKTNIFEDFDCSNNGVGKYIIQTHPRGSFVCERCRGGGSTVADFWLADGTDYVAIRNGNFEGSARLLVTGGPSGAPFPVAIENVRWANNHLHADGRAIIFQLRGPLRVEGSLFHGMSKAMSVYFNPGGTVGSFLSIGNFFASTLTNPYHGTQPYASLGNLIDRNDGRGAVVLP